MERKFWIYIIALVVLISIAHTMAYNDEVIMEASKHEAVHYRSEATHGEEASAHPVADNMHLLADRD